MLIHIKIVLERKVNLEYSVSVAVLTSEERQFSSKGGKLSFVLVIPKAIVGSNRDNETVGCHRNNQTVLHRKTLKRKNLTYTYRRSA